MRKKLVISGATKGIGRAIINLFAKNDFDIAVCARTEEDLTQLSKELTQSYKGIEIITYKGDVSQKKDVLAFAALVKKHWTHIDVLINNAGVFLPGAITEEEENVLEKTMETNVYSAYHLTRALLPLVKKVKGAYIFNMCSIASFMAYPNGGSYSISKYALLGFSKVLRAELASQHVRVSAVMPGATWSNSWSGADFPEDRLMDASDIADIIYSSYKLNIKTVVEEIILRPQLGDL